MKTYIGIEPSAPAGGVVLLAGTVDVPWPGPAVPSGIAYPMNVSITTVPGGTSRLSLRYDMIGNTMVAIKGHFDGKVIVPDEPVDLPTNQRIIIHIQSVGEQTPDFRDWLGLGLRAPKNPTSRFETDDDLWGS